MVLGRGNRSSLGTRSAPGVGSDSVGTQRAPTQRICAARPRYKYTSRLEYSNIVQHELQGVCAEPRSIRQSGQSSWRSSRLLFEFPPTLEWNSDCPLQQLGCKSDRTSKLMPEHNRVRDRDLVLLAGCVIRT